jgi:hypothetical protein
MASTSLVKRIVGFPTRNVDESHQRAVVKAKARLKKRKELKLIAKSKSRPKGIGIFGIKKRKQNKTLSRKRRISIF